MITKVYKNIIELAKDYSDRNIVSSFLNDVLEKDIKFKVLFGMMVFQIGLKHQQKFFNKII